MADDTNVSGKPSGGAEWRGYAQLALVLVAIAAALWFARAPAAWSAAPLPARQPRAPDLPSGSFTRPRPSRH